MTPDGFSRFWSGYKGISNSVKMFPYSFSDSHTKRLFFTGFSGYALWSGIKTESLFGWYIRFSPC
jgi:hypothetical protein